MFLFYPSMLRNFPRESLAKRVADTLRKGILLERYKQGETMREADLIKKLGVSNSVIREAFLALKSAGIVVNDPFRGRSFTNSRRTSLAICL